MGELRQRETALIVMVVVVTGAVLMAVLAATGIWFLRKRPSRRQLPAVDLDPLPGSPAAEA